ncbi:protein SMAX1-LIKE 3-like [Prosopis cineraria]|uniref:protein SMAX1-LIKE 3-like n=1 Tax=Prosopis cineraria TaxID=364024 RepID=UPI0024100346|nr:protein SMAX1-LIKE 3-like [Prosopis cineraria]
MRAGICSIQLQALTAEAANVVKQAVSLATRRGHAQVTPLHVASAMLATSAGLLRRACLQCHSHPLQCKALELCFNVALNRLPASTPSPLLGPHYSTHCNSNNTPSLSNALVAAFKRAQSHQRRGSIETQNQPILALKIELEQLVISILDDPSVSRVMREAGFSSTLVKSKVEQSVSVEIPSQQQNTTAKSKPPPQVVGHFEGSLVLKPIKRDNDNSNNVNNDDDVESVVSEVLNRRRNVVVVSESVGNAEGLARGAMERIGNVVQVVSIPLVSFRNIRKEEVERKILELRCLVKSYMGGSSRGVVLYLGDLKWLFEFWESHCCANNHQQEMMMMMKSYCSVEHMVMEVKRLVSASGGGEMSTGNRVSLMGISTFKTYIKCKTNCHPSLETLWELYPFRAPVPSLSLSLNIHRDLEAQDGCFEDESSVRKNLTCCRDCSVSFDREAQSIINTSRLAKKDCSGTTMSISSTSRLPTWLQNCKQEKRSHPLDDQDKGRLRDLCKKWNSFCSTVHRHTCNMQLLSEPKEAAKSECELYTDDVVCYESNNLIMFMPDNNNNKPDLLSNPNSSPNSASSSEAMDGLDSTHMFTELNEENLKILSDSMEKKVSSKHKHVVHEISSTVLRCRSGISSRENRKKRQDTWMLFLGDDCNNEEKESVSRELAKTVFGTYTNFITINGLSSPVSLSSDDQKMKKRKRTNDDDNDDERTFLERFGEALNENPHRVFFIIMEDLDEAEEEAFRKSSIKEAIKSGTVRLNGELIPLKDAIVILSCERSCHSCPLEKKIKDDQSLCLDLNIAIDDGEYCTRIGVQELVDKQIIFNTHETLIGDDQEN